MRRNRLGRRGIKYHHTLYFNIKHGRDPVTDIAAWPPSIKLPVVVEAAMQAVSTNMTLPGLSIYLIVDSESALGAGF